jgi:hypothetical protein
MKTYLFIALQLFMFTFSSQSQEPQNNLHSYGIFYDEDQSLVFFGLKKLNEDRNYTLGVGFYFSAPSLHKSFLFWPLIQINRGLGLDSNSGYYGVRSLTLANGSFTPEDLKSADPIFDDRPYGSITHFQTATSFVDNGTFRKTATSLSVGVLATYIARSVQTFVHTIGGWQIPEGWHNQISQKWEPTAMAAFRKERLINRKNKDELGNSKWSAELKHGWGASLGYYTGANYMFSFRAGKVDPKNWSYEVSPLFGSNKYLDQDENKARYSEFYFFTTARPYITLYNALLNGQFVKSIHTFSFGETKHLILEFDGGLGVSALGKKKKGSTDIKLKFSGHSPEFKASTRPARWHYYGGLDIVVNKW